MQSVVISVGYCWSNDAEWKLLRKVLGMAVQEAQSRWVTRLTRAVEFDDSELETSHSKSKPAMSAPRCDIRRLRGGAGRFAWEDISGRIDRSDILIFDITPPANSEKNRDNVMLELGYALGRYSGRDVPVLVVARDGSFFNEWIPSDLKGIILAGYHQPMKSGKGNSPESTLRMTLVNALLRAFDRAIEDIPVLGRT